jgi:hypothetical protein
MAGGTSERAECRTLAGRRARFRSHVVFSRASNNTVVIGSTDPIPASRLKEFDHAR